MLVRLLLLFSRLNNRSGIRKFHSKVFSSELKTFEWDILNPDYLIWVSNGHTYDLLLNPLFLDNKRENQKTKHEGTRNQKKIRQGERKKKTWNIKQRKKETKGDGKEQKAEKQRINGGKRNIRRLKIRKINKRQKSRNSDVEEDRTRRK